MAYNVLIVDDSKIVRTVIQRAIELSGVEGSSIYQAANGREALDLMEIVPVDVLFADINMPVMNGLEMVEEMGKKGLAEKIPVVVVSTDRSEVHIRQLREFGVRDYLNKPFTPESIRDILLTCLKKPGAGPGPGA